MPRLESASLKSRLESNRLAIKQMEQLVQPLAQPRRFHLTWTERHPDPQLAILRAEESAICATQMQLGLQIQRSQKSLGLGLHIPALDIDPASRHNPFKPPQEINIGANRQVRLVPLATPPPERPQWEVFSQNRLRASRSAINTRIDWLDKSMDDDAE